MPGNFISAQFVISKSQKCAWLVSQNREAHRNRRTNLSMPTIGESANTASDLYLDSADISESTSNLKGTARRARSMKLPATSHHSLGAGLSRSFRRRSPAALEGARSWLLAALRIKTRIRLLLKLGFIWRFEYNLQFRS